MNNIIMNDQTQDTINIQSPNMGKMCGQTTMTNM